MNSEASKDSLEEREVLIVDDLIDLKDLEGRSEIVDQSSERS